MSGLRRAVLVAVASLALPLALSAQGSTAFSIAGGVDAPVGRLGDISDLGYTVALGLNLGGPLVPVGLRFEGAYNSTGLKGGGGDVRILAGTGNAVFSLGPQADAPYLIGGLGVYNRSLGSTRFGYGSGSTALGVNGGGGLRFPLAGLSTFFEARYHVMLGNERDGTNFQFIPITFGIMF